MFDHKHYVPIIPWKMGERIALRELFESDRRGIVPLIEIPQNFVDKNPSVFETGKFIHSILPEIASCWGNGLAFVDLHALARLSSTNVTRHIETFFHYSAEAGLKLCPVVRVQLPGSYGEAICKGVQSTQAMCLRLRVKDFEGNAITGRIEAVLSEVNLSPSSVHLLMDLQLVNGESPTHLVRYERLPYLSMGHKKVLESHGHP